MTNVSQNEPTQTQLQKQAEQATINKLPIADPKAPQHPILNKIISKTSHVKEDYLEHVREKTHISNSIFLNWLVSGSAATPNSCPFFYVAFILLLAAFCYYHFFYTKETRNTAFFIYMVILCGLLYVMGVLSLADLSKVKNKDNLLPFGITPFFVSIGLIILLFFEILWKMN